MYMRLSGRVGTRAHNTCGVWASGSTRGGLYGVCDHVACGYVHGAIAVKSAWTGGHRLRLGDGPIVHRTVRIERRPTDHGLSIGAC